MITSKAIDDGLLAHAEWKRRLRDALDTGKSEFHVDVVGSDAACQFGKWLYGLPTEDQKSEEFKKVKELHAEFHTIASRVLDLALKGKKKEALELLSYTGEYGRVTGKLVMAMNKWKEKL